MDIHYSKEEKNNTHSPNQLISTAAGYKATSSLIHMNTNTFQYLETKRTTQLDSLGTVNHDINIRQHCKRKLEEIRYKVE